MCPTLPPLRCRRVGLRWVVRLLYEHHCDGRRPFAPAGESQAVGGGGLVRHRRRVDLQGPRHTDHHVALPRREARSFTNDRYVDVRNHPTGIYDALGVGVAREAWSVRNGDPSKNERARRIKSVGIETEPNPHDRNSASATAKSPGRVSLRFDRSPSTMTIVPPICSINCASSVASLPRVRASSCAARSFSVAKAWGVCVVHKPARAIVASTRPSTTRLRVSSTGSAATAPSAPALAATTASISALDASGRAAS